MPGARARGRGMAHGIEFAAPGTAHKVAAAAFDLRLSLSRQQASEDQVRRLLPPLTIGDDELELGLGMLASAVTRAAA